MSPLSLMEWNSKSPIQWDWENLFNATSEIPKKSRLEDWELEGEKGIDSASIYSSGSGGKSSKSPSNNSSAAAEAALPAAISSPFSSGEPLLGLKLGKRTYFEDVCGGSGPKTASFAVIPGGNSNSPPKKSKSGNTPATRCQVEGCNLDLSSAKDYHRKHRVCENHSKSPKVIVAGLERRFCQQCSRFHGLSEFDEKKRSCRRRLSDHNARRRKPQPEAVQLNPARLTTSFYDERQQIGFVWNRAPVNPSLTVEGTSSTKFTITKEYVVKPGKGSLNTNQLHFPSNEPVPLHHHASKTILPSKPKVATAEVLNQGLEESMVATSVDATQDLHRALSLLSTNSWGSSDPNHSGMPQVRVQGQAQAHARAEPVLQNIPQGVPIPPGDYWRTAQHSQNDANNYYQEFQLLRSPYDTDFYSGQLN